MLVSNHHKDEMLGALDRNSHQIDLHRASIASVWDPVFDGLTHSVQATLTFDALPALTTGSRFGDLTEEQSVIERISSEEGRSRRREQRLDIRRI